MALEEAGISLIAQNYNKYISQLGKIDKLQQEIFDVDDKELAGALDKATKAAKRYEKELKDVSQTSEKAGVAARGIGLATAGAAGVGIAAISKLTDVITNLASTAANAFVEITRRGVELNQQAELTERVFTNVFGDPNLGKATVDFLNETADRLRVARDDASQFAQVVLPKTSNLEEFTELLRLTDIQADTTAQSFNDLKFAISEAITGDFTRIRERFDLGPDQIRRIRELTPALGGAGAVAKVLNEEFARLGKQDISGTLGTNIKDLNTRFSNLQATLGKPTFEQLRVQSENLLGALDRNEEGLNRTAIALGEVTSNVVELIGTEIVEFIDNLDFAAIEKGIDNVNQFVEALRVLSKTVKIAFQTGIIQTAFGLLTGNVNQLLTGIEKIRNADFGQAFNDIGAAVKTASDRQEDYKKRVDEAANSQSSFTDANRAAIDAFLQQGAAQDQSTRALESYNNILKQAEQLQRSFARAAEDSARQLARANEDIARKQARDVAKLEESQAKDRDKLLQDQAKQLDKFEKDRRKQIANAEGEIRKERQAAAEQRKRDQDKLNRELQRAQERFNLDQLQSERRFRLQESRLIAEGDVIGLKELREDFSLQQQEEKENFSLSQKEQKESAKEQQAEQTRDLEKRLNDLKVSLEDQRAELLQSFDEQLLAQQESQLEARLEQQRAFAEQAEDRAIALAREEEDRRISQQRQLEDLGRSFAEQEGITAEGAAAIAGELEKVFGIDGAADQIMTGFTTKTENEFTELFANLENIVKGADLKPEPVSLPIRPVQTPGLGVGTQPGRIGGVQEFQEGGIVRGPLGSPQVAIVHAGETVLPTHKSSYQMTAPVIPSQSLNVNMSGGFSITGDGQANEAILQQATAKMTEVFRIAVERAERRN